jgi:hypothetical protein
MKAQYAKELSLAIAATVMLAVAANWLSAQSPPSASPNSALNPPVAVQVGPVGAEPVPVPTRVRIPSGGDAYIYAETVDSNDPRARSLQGLDALLKKLKESKEENREQITKDVETALTEYFDLDMKHRKEELDRLTKRADDTDAKLKKREDARKELIDLQLESYEQDANGLGLFGEQGRNALSMRIVGWQNGYPLANYMSRSKLRTTETEDPREKALNEIQKAQGKLKDAKTDEDKTAALKELETALGTYFDRDMEQRRKDLEEVREELKEMETRLKTRTDSKGEIVALQLKIFVNEANGLGFFNGEDSARPGIPGGTGVLGGMGSFGSSGSGRSGAGLRYPETAPPPVQPKR